MRLLILFLIFIFSHQTSKLVASEVWIKNCSEKSHKQFELLNNAYVKYGTAYSGGDHSGYLDHVSGTIELYRALNNLKHFNFYDAEESSNYDLYSKDPQKELILAINQIK